MKSDNEQLTIKEAREIMIPQLHKGVECLCCGQNAQIYVRPITSAMAMALILIYNDQKDHDQYMHLEKFFKAMKDIPTSLRADVHKLRFWNLIEAREGVREDGNPHNGYYRITGVGRLFVEECVKAWSHVEIQNNEMLRFAPEAKAITIREALKNKFNYDKIVKP